MSPSRKPTRPDFEASLHRLEEIVQRLEQGDVPLEESLGIYEEGVRLSRQCLEQLRDAELRLKKLVLIAVPVVTVRLMAAISG